MTDHTGSLRGARSSVADLLRRLRDFIKNHRDVVLLVVSILLIILAVSVATWLADHAFQHEFSCTHLVDESLSTDFLCKGVKIPKNFFVLFPKSPVTILPGLEPITSLLEPVRRFLASTIILAFVVISLVLALIVGKVKSFIDQLRDPIKRRAILTNVNIWLLIFAIFCGLFYFQVVVSP